MGSMGRTSKCYPCSERGRLRVCSGGADLSAVGTGSCFRTSRPPCRGFGGAAIGYRAVYGLLSRRRYTALRDSADRTALGQLGNFKRTYWKAHEDLRQGPHARQGVRGARDKRFA